MLFILFIFFLFIFFVIFFFWIFVFFFNDTATTEIYTLFPTRRSSDLSGLVPSLFALFFPQGLSFRWTLIRSEEHTSELQSQSNLVCRLLLEKKKHTAKIEIDDTESSRSPADTISEPETSKSP